MGIAFFSVRQDLPRLSVQIQSQSRDLEVAMHGFDDLLARERYGDAYHDDADL
jgi:hypothetical protein